jgi:hypothetical protein
MPHPHYACGFFRFIKLSFQLAFLKPKILNATESLLFNDLFIEYLQWVFSENESRKFEYDEIGRSLPTFYQLPELVKAGISFLLKKKIIIQTLENGIDLHQISSDIIAQRRKENENQELNSEIDLSNIKGLIPNSLIFMSILF